MRRSVFAVFGSIVLAVSMVTTWPVGFETVGELAVTGPGHGTVLAADIEGRFLCVGAREDPTPGFKRCELMDGTQFYLFWNGDSFIGTPIEAQAMSGALLTVSGFGNGMFRSLMNLFGGSPNAFYLAFVMLLGMSKAYGGDPEAASFALLLMLIGIGEFPTGETTTEPLPPARPSSSSPENPITIAPSLNYRLAWEPGSSSCGFDGKLTGDLDRWTYSGRTFTASEGDKDSCYPGALNYPGGTARCTLEGKSVAALPAGDVSMECHAVITDKSGKKHVWEATFKGTLAPYEIDHEVAGVAYGGVAEGNATVGLEPCAPGKIC